MEQTPQITDPINVLDLITDGEFTSEFQFLEKTEKYHTLLNSILETRITKSDSSNEIIQKIKGSIEMLGKLKIASGDPERIDLLSKIFRVYNGYYASGKQVQKIEDVLKKRAMCDTPMPNFPLLDFLLEDDIGVIYTYYEHGKKNHGYRYFFVDKSGVRLVVEQYYCPAQKHTEDEGLPRMKHYVFRSDKNDLNPYHKKEYQEKILFLRK